MAEAVVVAEAEGVDEMGVVDEIGGKIAGLCDAKGMLEDVHGIFVGEGGRTKGGVGFERTAVKKVKAMTSLENILFYL